LYAQTDAQRGVWKAPAGLTVLFNGISGLSVPLTDSENGALNPLGVNCLRSFSGVGPVVWGARTLRGSDQFADEYKYVPVRRTALFIEESLYEGLKWAVFEPNADPLWAEIRLNVGSFMQTLFRQGAFQGTTPQDAYFVKCDSSTNPQSQIDLGIVTVVVGFAPLKPAEFVVIQIQQITGQGAA
jgi:phage tail sheath protein FI